MEAIAHSPSFAKKAGVPQSVGKDYAAADKGKKFAGGGKAVINKQDTKHGKMDMPFNKLNRFAEMKTGGFMKESKAMVGKEMAFMKKKGAPKSMIKHEAAEMGAMKKGGMPMKDGKPAFMQKKMMGGGSVKKFREGGVSEDTRAATRETVANRRQAADERAAVIEAKRLGVENARKDAKSSRAYNHASRNYQREMLLNPPGTVSGSFSKFTDTVGDKMRGVGKLFGSNRVTSQDDEAQMQAREDVKGYKKGGMPMKNGKPAFMQKKMMGGGMAKYAKGGGIESRGKTKGMMVKMATGGVVKFAKGGGIESKGKTKGTMIKMKGC